MVNFGGYFSAAFRNHCCAGRLLPFQRFTIQDWYFPCIKACLHTYIHTLVSKPRPRYSKIVKL